jgi:transposase
MQEGPPLSQSEELEKDALIGVLFLEVQKLSEQISVLSAQLGVSNAQLEESHAQLLLLSREIASLKSQPKLDSHNSSTPPSSDGLGKKTRSLREPSGKRPGGQIGHKGTTLKRVAEPTEIVCHALPQQCDHCGKALDNCVAEIWGRRQVIDIPVTPYEVIEHQTLAAYCRCGRRHTSAFPAGVREAVQYGPQIRALGVHLTQGQLLPFARATHLIADQYGLKISRGSLVRWVDEARVVLQRTADAIAEDLRNAALVHADESGLRVQGKLNWLHVVADATHTWYGVHPKRGLEAIEAQDILPKRLGILVHDCWSSYWKLDGEHALCNAHLLRELVYIKELCAHENWPQKMIDFLKGTWQRCETAREANTVLMENDFLEVKAHYDAILCEAEQLHPEALKPKNKRGRAKQSIAFNLLRRLRQHTEEVLRFARDLTVPFSNNVAEQAIRMPKVKQKISGSFRAPQGAENFCVIRTCLETARKQGQNMLDILRSIFSQTPVQPDTS